MEDSFNIRLISDEREIVISIDERHLERLKDAIRDWMIDNKIDAEIAIKR